MSFAKDFIWGVATASYQIEGAAYEDGKGLSIWDEFCKQPNRVFDAHNGDIACDHYHLFKEDVKLMAELGIKAYRFSISWSRVIPNGTGEINMKGIDFYSQLVDELLKYNIIPFITLYHWDMPYALYQRGGWLNPECKSWFKEYTGVVSKFLGDRVKHFITFNEPQCFIGISYIDTILAPGIKVSQKDALQMAHNIMVAHGLSVRTLRESIEDVQVGYAPTGKYYHPLTGSEADIAAAKMATFSVTRDWGFSVSWWSDPVLTGKYPDNAYELFGDDMPEIEDGDLEIMSTPLDFYGQNIYHSSLVKSDGKDGFEFVRRPVGYPKTAYSWPVTPESLNYIPRFLYERYKKPVIITENGLSCHDWPSLDGKVHDVQRVDFLHRYLLELKKSIEGGTDVRGYFQWSFMDNFEWAQGYNERFGMVYVDYETQRRIPKESAYWYKEVIETNGEHLQLREKQCHTNQRLKV